MSYLAFDMGLCRFSEVEEGGFIGVQIDAHGEQESGVQTYELHHALGFAARPLDPEVDENGEPIPSAACTILYALEGGQGHAIALGDPRSTLKLVPLRKGGAIFYCPAAGSYALFEGLDPEGKKAPGTFALSVPYGPENGRKSMLVSCNVRDAGKEFIRIQHGNGATIDVRWDGAITITDATGNYLEVGKDGLIANGDMHVQGSLSAGNATAARPLACAEPLLALLSAIEKQLLIPAVPGSPIMKVPLVDAFAAKIKSKAVNG